MWYIENSVMVNWHIDGKPYDTLSHKHGHALSACHIFTLCRDRFVRERKTDQLLKLRNKAQNCQIYRNEIWVKERQLREIELYTKCLKISMCVVFPCFFFFFFFFFYSKTFINHFLRFLVYKNRLFCHEKKKRKHYVSI